MKHQKLHTLPLPGYEPHQPKQPKLQNTWREIALELATHHVSNARLFAELKTVSFSKRKRLVDVCMRVKDLLEGTQPPKIYHVEQEIIRQTIQLKQILDKPPRKRPGKKRPSS